MAKQVLGRGLGALLAGGSSASKLVPRPAPAPTPPAVSTESGVDERVVELAVDQIHPCPFQPRKDFSDGSIQELADSIREKGIVQPLLVRSAASGFELIAGERRWRAAQRAGLTRVPAIIRQADDRTVLELALIENLQRENLNPMEEAQGYSLLIDQFQLRQEDVATRVGKSRAVVANALRLLKLRAEVQGQLREGRLSVGHAKVVLGLERPEDQLLAVHKILKDELSVRQAEELVARLQAVAATESTGRKSAPPVARDPHVADLEERLQQRLGTKVLMRYRKGRGAIDIRFFSDDDLDRVLQILGVGPD